MGFAHILNTQWKDTHGKKFIYLLPSTIFHLNLLTCMSRGGHLYLSDAPLPHIRNKWQRINKPREQQLFTQTADQMGSGQRYQDINPNFPVPWLPNTHQYSGMYHLFYLLQTIVVSNPALASFEPESQLKQYPIKTNYLLLKDSNNEQDTLLKKH